MKRVLTRWAIVLTALGVSLLSASAAPAAIRSEFFGIEQGPGPTLDGTDMKAMRAARVHTVRYLFQWESVQPTKASFRWGPQDNFIGALASRGIRVVPTVWGNPKWVTGYTAHAPIDRPADRLAWQAFLKAVADPANQPVYIHCASANRVGAMWFIKRVKLDGWDTDRAMKEAETIGLRAPNLKEFALEYVSTKR